MVNEKRDLLYVKTITPADIKNMPEEIRGLCEKITTDCYVKLDAILGAVELAWRRGKQGNISM